MTMPDERTRAVVYAREFMRDLLDPKKTPRIPRYIRERASRCLRHFPGDYDLDKAAEAVPRSWGPCPPREDGGV
jgi:hypothetical protein